MGDLDSFEERLKACAGKRITAILRGGVGPVFGVVRFGKSDWGEITHWDAAVAARTSGVVFRVQDVSTFQELGPDGEPAAL